MNESESEWQAEVHSGVLVQQIVGVIITGVVTLLGLLGNSVSFVLLSKTRRSSMFIILRTLLISDSVVLLFYFVSQILPNLYELFHVAFFVQVHKVHGYLLRSAWPLVMTAQMTSVWLTVLISVERWFAVCKPFTIGAMLNKKRTTRFVICISATALLYNLPRYFEYNLHVMPDSTEQVEAAANSTMGCEGESEAINDSCASQNESDTWTFVVKSEFGASRTYTTVYCAVLYSLFMFVVPISLIGPLNTLIIVQLRQSRRQWPALSRQQRHEERITLLPIWIVGLFCLCSMPSTLVNILEAAQISIEQSVWDTLMPITNLLVTLNSAINCVVYCAFTRQFCQICARVFCKRHETGLVNSLRSVIRTETYEQQALCSINVDELSHQVATFFAQRTTLVLLSRRSARAFCCYLPCLWIQFVQLAFLSLFLCVCLFAKLSFLLSVDDQSVFVHFGRKPNGIPIFMVFMSHFKSATAQCPTQGYWLRKLATLLLICCFGVVLMTSSRSRQSSKLKVH